MIYNFLHQFKIASLIIFNFASSDLLFTNFLLASLVTFFVLRSFVFLIKDSNTNSFFIIPSGWQNHLIEKIYGFVSQFQLDITRDNQVMPKAFTGNFLIRGSLITQNRLKACFTPKGARFFSSNRTEASPENQKGIKTILCDMFLKYQFTVCVEPRIPFSHLIPLSWLTCLFNSLYHVTIYCVSILYIIFTLYIAKKFPDSFGSRYLSFLKYHSTTEAFEKYCGNSWGVLKAAIKNPAFIKIVARNGVGKAVSGIGVVIAIQHILHTAKVGQIYDYQVEQYLNGGKPKPFELKPNGPSILDKIVARDGK